MAKLDKPVFRLNGEVRFARMDEDGKIEMLPPVKAHLVSRFPSSVGETAPQHERTFTITTREAINRLLAIIDPREWERQNWWKLPALWKRNRD